MDSATAAAASSAVCPAVRSRRCARASASLCGTRLRSVQTAARRPCSTRRTAHSRRSTRLCTAYTRSAATSRSSSQSPDRRRPARTCSRGRRWSGARWRRACADSCVGAPVPATAQDAQQTAPPMAVAAATRMVPPTDLPSRPAPRRRRRCAAGGATARALPPPRARATRTQCTGAASGGALCLVSTVRRRQSVPPMLRRPASSRQGTDVPAACNASQAFVRCVRATHAPFPGSCAASTRE